MTRKKESGPRPSRAAQRPTAPPAKAQSFWHLILQREIWGLIATAAGAISTIALVSRTQGKLSEAWALLLRQIFGIGAYPIALLLVAGGIALLFWSSLQQWSNPRWQAVVGVELIFFAGLGLVHIAAQGSPLDLAKAGQYGGYIGWTFSQLLVPLFGKALALILLTVPLLAGLYLTLGISWSTLAWRVRWVGAQLGRAVRAVTVPRPAVGPQTTRPLSSQSPRLVLRPKLPTTPPFLEGKPRPKAAITPVATKPAAAQKTLSQAPRPSKHEPARAPAGLPPLDLLPPDEATNGDESDARLKAQIIEETLEAFGIPTQVLSWHKGPTVTQFDVEPGYVEQQDRDGNLRRFKIRVSKILGLTNDLALALAAAPIRIEAPVPGRAVVGIEVPNTVKSMVGLHGMLTSPQFRKVKGQLRIALGRDVSGEPVIADLAAMPHLLLAGTTGSGKSACLNAIIASLLFSNTPSQLNLLLIDPKRVEMVKYNGIPHLLSPVVTDIEKVIVALRWLTKEMERRYARFAEAGARNLEGFNKVARSKDLEPLPMIVVIIDELADLMLAAPDDVERTLCRLAQMARATGIHIVIATQRPSVDVVTGLIKANFPARISFAVTSQVDSRVILDTPGAEKLLGRGDMLFMAPDSPKLLRIQGCFVSDKELDALAAFWRSATTPEEHPAPAQPAPWEQMSLDEGDSDDALIEKATTLVRAHNQASASFLQRQMRIGYPRAARLIDQLEKAGVVGPPEAGGRSRSVIPVSEDDVAEPAESELPGEEE